MGDLERKSDREYATICRNWRKHGFRHYWSLFIGKEMKVGQVCFFCIASGMYRIMDLVIARFLYAFYVHAIENTFANPSVRLLVVIDV